jgi:hypothetical protein
MGLLSTSIPGRATNLARGRNKRHLSWLPEPLRRTSNPPSKPHALGSGGKAGNSGVLSRRQPGLWRSGGRSTTRSSRSSASTMRNRWVFRPTGSGAMRPLPATATCIFAVRRFRTQGRGGKEIPRLSCKRGRLRTCAACPRPAGHDCMELLLADRGQSRRRWNS